MEAEVRQLGVLQWHKKKGIRCEKVFGEEKKFLKHSLWSIDAQKSRKALFLTQFWPYFDDLATFALRRAILLGLKIKV